MFGFNPKGQCSQRGAHIPLLAYQVILETFFLKNHSFTYSDFSSYLIKTKYTHTQKHGNGNLMKIIAQDKGKLK